MGRRWRNFFYFTKADRRAVLLLAGVLVGMVLSASFFLWFGHRGTGEEDVGEPSGYEDFFAGLERDSLPAPRAASAATFTA